MSKIEVNEIDAQSGNTITVGSACKSVAVPGNVVKTNAVQASDAGNIISQSGTTITLGASGDTISLASGASQTGFGRTGTVDWDTTAKTASFTAVSGNGYFVNTTSGAITVTLPASPSAGDIVSIADYAGTAATNSITIARNGSNFEGGTSNGAISTNRQTGTFIYVDGTQGWVVVNSNDASFIAPAFVTATGGTVTTSGDFKIHTFTGPGTFAVSQISTTAAENTVGYQVVGGGGGGKAGGGGAGGFREGRNVPIDNFTASPLVANAPTNAITLTATSYPITVGAGGAINAVGGVSTFSTITSAGGGEGGCGASDAGGNGGSGGGGGFQCGPAPSPSPTGGGAGGAGNTPPVSPSQGSTGGAGGSGYYYTGGGGGGAGATGSAGTTASPGGGPTSGGNGGNGVSSSITGSSVTRAGGGGGMRWTQNPGTPGQGGTGGGGDAGAAGAAGTAGTVNTGGGGGARSDFCGPTAAQPAAAGGSGIVIIRYKFQ